MCGFVKLFYMCSNCLVFVCGLKHEFVGTQNYAQIVVHICKCLVEVVVNIELRPLREDGSRWYGMVWGSPRKQKLLNAFPMCL